VQSFENPLSLRSLGFPSFFFFYINFAVRAGLSQWRHAPCTSVFFCGVRFRRAVLVPVMVCWCWCCLCRGVLRTDLVDVYGKHARKAVASSSRFFAFSLCAYLRLVGAGVREQVLKDAMRPAPRFYPQLIATPMRALAARLALPPVQLPPTDIAPFAAEKSALSPCGLLYALSVRYSAYRPR
jgi:hypothetical protein